MYLSGWFGPWSGSVLGQCAMWTARGRGSRIYIAQAEPKEVRGLLALALRW